MATIDNFSRVLRHTAYRLAALGLVDLAEFTPGMGLDEIKAEYADTLYGAMTGYLDSEKPITAFRNEVRRAESDAFTLAFYAGYADAGGSGELPEGSQDWLNARIDSEIGFADELFQSLKTLRIDKEQSQADKLSWCQVRASSYTATLDAIYSQGRSYADEDWEFGGESGLESCTDCQDLMGQIHPASWWREHELIPGPGGNRDNFECGLWQCHHNLRNKKGEIVAGYMG